jgi:hypothetical protein
MIHKIFLPFCLYFLILFSQSCLANNEATIQISVPSGTKIDSLVFPPKMSALPLTGASLATGVWNGLALSFSAKTNTGETEVFELEIPSTNDLKFFEKDGKEQNVEVQPIQPFPYTITAKSYENLKVLHHDQPLRARISFQREKKKDYQSTDVKYLSLSVYSITIQTLKIEKGHLWLKATLNATIDPAYRMYNDANYSLAASITIEDVPLTRMFVD